MGEFQSGHWIVGIMIYYFFFFIIVFFVVQASTDYDLTNSARFQDPGFASVNTNIGAICQGSSTSSAVGFCSLTRAMDEGSLMLFVTDSISGIMPSDKEVAAILRKFNKPIPQII